MDGLAKTLRGLSIHTPWPPPYFSARELVVLTEGHVMSAIGGVDNVNRLSRELVPAVHSFSPPTDVRLPSTTWLCSIIPHPKTGRCG